MTVSIQDTIFPYTGNGITTEFAYDCKILSSDDLYVFVADARITSGFTVDGIGSASGGSITFSTAPANGISIRLERKVALKRDTNYAQNGDFKADVVNPDFDRIWMGLQQQQAALDCTINIPTYESNTTQLPSAAARANRALVFDADGNVAVSTDNYTDQLSNVTATAQAAAASAVQSAASAVQAAASAGQSGVSASLSAGSASVAQTAQAAAELAQSQAQAVAQSGIGFTSATAYDFGSVADPVVLFPTDFGSIL